MSESLPRISRRSALASGGATACACALAACGSGGSSGASQEKVDALVPISSVPVGGGMVDSENKIVVSQPTRGTFKAFSSVCTHQGCQVSAPKDGIINCPCHGSQFDAATGDVKAAPATEALPAKKVVVQGGNLHITG